MNQPLLALALFGTLLGGVRDEGARVSRDPGPRAEYFVLELPAATPAPDTAPGLQAPREVGVVCLRRRALHGGFQLEAEWLFRRSEEEGGDERVLHVEQILDGGARLIWREWGPSRARSLSADRSADGLMLSTVDSGRGGTGRETISAQDGAVMPLELLERVRFAETIPATCDRFEPLSRILERVEVKLLPREAQGEEAGHLRVAQLVRADGSIAGRYEFAGTELQSFRSQDSDLVARRVTEEEYRTRTPHPAVSIQRP